MLRKPRWERPVSAPRDRFAAGPLIASDAVAVSASAQVVIVVVMVFVGACLGARLGRTNGDGSRPLPPSGPSPRR